MIFDHRTYTVRPGTMPAYLKLYEQYGYGPQTRHLGEPVLYASTETGNVNSFVHIWAYEDAADRATRRGAMWADPEWLAYTQRVGELGALVSQVTAILVAAPFFTYSPPGSA